MTLSGARLGSLGRLLRGRRLGGIPQRDCGRSGTGVPPVVTAAVPRGTAKAQREHEKNDKEAQREHERLTGQRAARAQQIAIWRDGLNRSALTYEGWAHIYDNDRQRQEAIPRGEYSPNLVSDAWFQSLRPHLPAQYREQNQLHCDAPTVVAIANEIDRIEGEWQI